MLNNAKKSREKVFAEEKVSGFCLPVLEREMMIWSKKRETHAVPSIVPEFNFSPSDKKQKHWWTSTQYLTFFVFYGFTRPSHNELKSHFWVQEKEKNENTSLDRGFDSQSKQQKVGMYWWVGCECECCLLNFILLHFDSIIEGGWGQGQGSRV